MKYFSLFPLLWMFPAISFAEIHVVKVGLASNFSEVSTNSFNPYGDYFRRGVNLALKHSEGLLKKKNIQIELEEFDYGTSKLKALDAARIAVKSSVMGVIGYNFSSDALIAAPIHRDGKLPMLSPSASADRLAKIGPYIHAGCFSNSFMGKNLAGYARKKLKIQNIATVVSKNCAYCVDLASAFQQEFLNLNGKIVAETSVLDTDTDFTDVISQLQGRQFDAILVPNQELISARVIGAILRSGIQTQFIGGDGWGIFGQPFFKVLAGLDVKGYSVSHWHPDSNSIESNRFKIDYWNSHHQKGNDSAVLAYDSMLLMIQALIQAKHLTREGLEDSLNAITQFKGATGISFFKKNAFPEKPLVFLSINKERFRVLETILPKGNN